jgi:hypothetical protein
MKELHEKLIVILLVKKAHALYGTQRPIIARHWALS